MKRATVRVKCSTNNQYNNPRFLFFLFFFYSVTVTVSIQVFVVVVFLLILFQWNVFQYPFQRRVVKAVHFLRETARKVIEVRKNVINNGDEVPDDILHINQQQGKLLPL